MTNDFRPADPLRPTAGPRADHGTAVDPAFDSTPVRPPFDSRPTPTPVEPPRVRARGGAGMLVNVLLGLALVVAIGGVAFAVGRATAPATASAAGRGGNGGFFQGGQGGQGGPNASGAPGGGFNGGFAAGGVSIQGTVTAISGDSITLQLTGGQTVTIPIDARTTYHQREAATAAAVTSGSTVVVQFQGGGRGAFGGGNGQGGGQNGGPTASGAPGRSLGPASTITVVPAGS